jgi:cysteine-rich repeat protein
VLLSVVWVVLSAACASDESPGMTGRGGTGGGAAGEGGAGEAGAGMGGSAPDPVCGDGVVQFRAGEGCDDGNADADDGCSATCEVENGYACITPGEPCSSRAECGDGFLTGKEECDDRNAESGDGCNADCSKTEKGWLCAAPGTACEAARCGDGLIRGFEVCDDGDSSAGDGCSEDCLLERDFACPEPGDDCVPIACGDNEVEGLEQCDYEDIDDRGGCSPDCRFEPQCADGSCTARCGDGLKLESEECDDGNDRDDDGCSSSCEIEAGFTCTVEVENPSLPIIYRDFVGTNDTGTDEPYPGNTPGLQHPDFEKYLTCSEQVSDTLVDGLPALENRTRGTACVESEATFLQWYVSDDTLNYTILDALEFEPVDADGNYISPAPADSTRFGFQDEAFFPLDGRGWNDPDSLQESVRDDHNDPPQQHNFHFTSEVRYWFTYKGGEKLTFYGDDDVWVFINGHLAVDIAGVHGRRKRWIQLPGPDAQPAIDGDSDGDDGTYGCFATGTTGCAHGYDSGEYGLDLELDGTYEVVVFQAERHVTESQYQLTLENFLSARSVCAPECGDGVVTRDEACDQGDMNSATLYGRCRLDCTWGDRCGDGVLQEDDEACDDGNLENGDGCDAGCGNEAPG